MPPEKEALFHLLERLKEILNLKEDARGKLQTSVSLIADYLKADVCSLYRAQEDKSLQLVAIHGLNLSALNKNILQKDEGLVGYIAAERQTVSASHNPLNFKNFQRSDLKNLQGFLGTPLLGEGDILGVITIQNYEQRFYKAEEIEALQTISVCLSESIMNGLLTFDEIKAVNPVSSSSLHLEGIVLNGGIAAGIVKFHQSKVSFKNVIAKDPAYEIERFKKAVAKMHGSLDRLFADYEGTDTEEHSDIFEAYRMFAADQGWLSKIRKSICDGLTAEAAVQKIQAELKVKFGGVANSLVHERLDDLEDIGNRLIRHLVGEDRKELLDLSNFVLVARSLGPAELLDYSRLGIRGVLLEEGSLTSHVAIIARTLDIPIIGHLPGILLKTTSDDLVIVDGDKAQVFIRPNKQTFHRFKRALPKYSKRYRPIGYMRNLPAITQNKIDISLNLNAGLLTDVQHLEVSGAAGIGLFRTEMSFMLESKFPDVITQANLYSKIMDAAGDKPIAFRTLDIGGDKFLPHLTRMGDENPIMGWRALRIALDRPLMLRYQMRALLQAARGRDLNIMFPMVAEVAEFRRAKSILKMEIENARAKGKQISQHIKIGTMIEVPALAWQIPNLLGDVDFISIGSNDLFQFFFAIDRGNPLLAHRYDVLSPSFLTFLKSIHDWCKTAQVPVSVCGEMAGRPLEAMALLGLGFTSLSMAVSSINDVRMMVRSLNLTVLQPYLAGLCRTSSHSIREKLRAFAKDHEIII